jgi:eukaryotic-like serine/threonine-protein kinase
VARLPASAPILAGFTYLRPLGSGGFADVFLYEQNLPRRQVAVKVLPTEVRDLAVRRMFHAEADSLARLSAHPSILTIHQASVAPDGRPYFVTEYCPASLGERYRRELIGVPEALAVGVKMACALETAHRFGLLHRDVKPSNLLITEFGAPVLSDFGIATSLTTDNRADIFAMSVPWSAPEIIAGTTAGSVGSEVWALGATIYSLLAGRSPFERAAGQNSVEQLKQRIAKAAYPQIGRADLPATAEGVIAAALRRDPAQRPASALEFAQALQSAQRECGLLETPLELATNGWEASGSGVNFSDESERGLTRVNVAHESRRKPTRSESLGHRSVQSGTTSLDQPPRETRTAWPWVVVGVVVTVVVGLVAWLLLSGVL